MTRAELRALWDAKEAARKAFMDAPSASKFTDPDEAFAAELEEKRLNAVATKAILAFEDALKVYSAEQVAT